MHVFWCDFADLADFEKLASESGVAWAVAVFLMRPVSVREGTRRCLYSLLTSQLNETLQSFNTGYSLRARSRGAASNTRSPANKNNIIG